MKIEFQSKFDSTSDEIFQIYHQFLDKKPWQQRSLCCLLGAYAGDNLGSYNEFSKEINEDQLNEAIKMNGRGVHSLLPGQSTDDTELATSLGYGLIESKKKGVMNIDMIAKYYGLWYKSRPFDIGNTTRAALQQFGNEKIDIGLQYEDYIYENFALNLKIQANKHNYTSKSNGGLMRITPLCVYLSQVYDQKQIKKAVYEEQSMTHCNQIPLECSYIYVRACVEIIQSGSAQKAFESVNTYIQNECQEQEIKQYWQNYVLKGCFTNTTQSEGFVIHAFTQAFILLKYLSQFEEQNQKINRRTIYTEFIRIIIKQCGDSDTNAAICGGLLGSYLQIKEFPQDYLFKIIKCNLQDQTQPLLKHPRPSIYNPRNCIYLCEKLLELGPNAEYNLKVYPVGLDQIKNTHEGKYSQKPINQNEEKFQENNAINNLQKQNFEININNININQPNFDNIPRKQFKTINADQMKSQIQQNFEQNQNQPTTNYQQNTNQQRFKSQYIPNSQQNIYQQYSENAQQYTDQQKIDLNRLNSQQNSQLRQYNQQNNQNTWNPSENYNNQQLQDQRQHQFQIEQQTDNRNRSPFNFTNTGMNKKK